MEKHTLSKLANTSKEALLACQIEGKRDFDLEKIIMTSVVDSFWYAHDVIKDRFYEAEKIIAMHPKYAFYYAHDVIKGVFPECHPFIFNSDYKLNYVNFLKYIDYDMTEISEWMI